VQNHTCSVRARITESGKLLFTTDQQYQVLTQGHGSEIGMMMLRRASPATSLRETYWKLIQLGEKPVSAADQQREPNLIFHTAENRVTGSGGCNRFTGTYMADSHALHFNGVASTQMACIQGMATEMAFLGMLDKVRTWKVTNQQLELYDASDKLLARFTAQAMK
jgi:putative lipoprotein